MAATQLTKEEAKELGIGVVGKAACVTPKNLAAIVACYNEIIRLLCECPDATQTEEQPSPYATAKK